MAHAVPVGIEGLKTSAIRNIKGVMTMWILKYKGEIVFTSWDFSKIEPTILMMQKIGMPVTYEWVDSKQPIVDIYA